MNKQIDVAGAPEFAHAVSWETSRAQSLQQSARHAWMAAGALGVCLLMALVAIVVMMPLKETMPYVIRVDNATGVPDIVTSIMDQKITGDEAMDKYWMARYVEYRERYDWYTLQDDYNMVGLLSTEDVAVDYAAQFDGENGLHKRYKDKIRAEIKIVSVVPTSKETGTVRYIKTTKQLKSNRQKPVVLHYVATVAFAYAGSKRMKDSERVRSPLGFKVTSFRIDSELNEGT